MKEENKCRKRNLKLDCQQEEVIRETSLTQSILQQEMPILNFKCQMIKYLLLTFKLYLTLKSFLNIYN